MSKTEPLSIRLDPELKLALQEIAKLEHRNMNNMIEFLIIEHCREKKISIKPTLVEEKNRAKSNRTRGSSTNICQTS